MGGVLKRETSGRKKPGSRRRRYIRFAMLGLLVLGVIAWLVMRYSGDDAGGYRTVHADLGPVEHLVQAVGRLEAEDSVEVGAEVSGTVVAVDVDFNSAVKKGDRLAQIDPAPFEAEVERLAARIREAEAVLQRDHGREKLAGLDLARLERDLERDEKLFAQGHLSKRAIDEQRTALGKAKAELEMARADLRGAVAQVDQLRAQLKRARRSLEKTTIRSPIDGIVIDRRVAVGQTVVSSFQASTLFTIAADLDRLRLVAEVTEADIGQVGPGQTVRFHVDAWPERAFTAKVDSVRPAARRRQGLVVYPVLIATANRDRLLLPGMTASVEILAQRAERTLRVPNAALAWKPGRGGRGLDLSRMQVRIVNGDEAKRLQRISGAMRTGAAGADDGPPTVWVLFADDPLPTPVKVKTGIRGEKYTQILSGDLKPGDRVVIGEERETDADTDTD